MRETALRIFAYEFSASDLEIKEGEEKGAVYLLTPLGAMVNRVFLTGVLTEVDSSDSEGGKMYRALVTDTTGTYRISSGHFSADASRFLEENKPPLYVGVVGKARSFTTEEGSVFVSVRAEHIAEISQTDRNYWICETCSETMKRINAMKLAYELSPPSVEALERLGVHRRMAEGAVRAAEHYGRVDLEAYRGMVVEALRSINGMEEAHAVEQQHTEENLNQAESTLLAIIGELDRNSRGAEWSEVVRKAEERKMNESDINAALEALLDKGMVYEPAIGRMKCI